MAVLSSVLDFMLSVVSSLVSSLVLSIEFGFGISLLGSEISLLGSEIGMMLHEGLDSGPIVLVTGMVIMWALSGGITVSRHYVIRWQLAHHQTFPFRAQDFLDDATSRILLQRVGGGYSFIHRRLQDYFADATVPPSQK